MSRQASSQQHSGPGDEGHASGHEYEPASFEPASKPETSQAERAAMHPERHDVEWNYYFTAWSH